MNKKFFAVIGILAMLLALLPGAVTAAPIASSGDDPALVQKEDNRPDPLTTQKLELKKEALEAQINGKAYGRTHEVAHGQFVELGRDGEDPIWTVLGEFADMKHNAMPAPDRSVDNSTIWAPNFNREYYLELLFAEGPDVNSMRQYYIEQSSNRYTVYGDVTDWVLVPGEAATYDDDFASPLGGNQVWYFLIDSLNGWYDMQIAAGKTPGEIDAYLKQFDVWDRYDWDEDGNFNESDGYIDHMQFVHAGVGNESCSPACDDWAIWSHSWFAFSSLIGVAGPSPEFLEGGVQIGDSSFWVNKYTIQPENGGVGVFTHEYGHDLGLPDLYDYTGENGTGFWTLMSSGSNLGGTEDIGSAPSHMGAWEKFQLGWLKYEVAFAGKTSSHKLGPMETNTKQAQGLFVVLPQKKVIFDLGAAYEGNNYYYSGAGDGLDYVMYKAVNLPAGSTLTAKVKYNIELNWDYAYFVYSTDGGVTWTPIQTNRSTDANAPGGNPNGQNFGYGITGSSSGWVDLTANTLPVGDVLLGFRYWTDANTGGFGFMVDNIAVTNYLLDGAESDAGWTYKPTTGFHVTTGIEPRLFDNYYVAEFRQYRGYDQSLRNAYNFGFLDNPALQDWVERFPYQDGLLINYWDTSFPNNDVTANCAAGRCGGLLLTIDAHPKALIRADGKVWRGRMQAYDATFSLDPTEAITLNYRSQPSYHPSLPAVSVFNDRLSYYDSDNPTGSVIVPITGTQIRIKSYSAFGNFMQVEVRPAK